MERTLALLAFDNPEESPFGDLLHMMQRQKVSPPRGPPSRLPAFGWGSESTAAASGRVPHGRGGPSPSLTWGLSLCEARSRAL